MPMNTPETNPYIRDILDQPAALVRTVEMLAECSDAVEASRRSTSRVVLTGMGASYHALVPLYYVLASQSRDVHLVETSELVHSLSALLVPGATMVVTSQSGESAEVLALLSSVPPDVTVIGVTNTADGTLATEASALVLTAAGAEHSVSSKTYTTALVALHWIGQILIGAGGEQAVEGLHETAAAVGRYLEKWPAHVGFMRARVGDASTVTLVGRGVSLATVGCGALILRESAHIAAGGMSSAAYRHGPIEMASRDEYVLAFAGAGQIGALVERLVADIRGVGGVCDAVRVGRGEGPLSLPEVPALLRPVVEILPAQVLSVALAERGGHSAGQFTRIEKVTKVE